MSFPFNPSTTAFIKDAPSPPTLKVIRRKGSQETSQIGTTMTGATTLLIEQLRKTMKSYSNTTFVSKPLTSLQRTFFPIYGQRWLFFTKAEYHQYRTKSITSSSWHVCGIFRVRPTKKKKKPSIRYTDRKSSLIDPWTLFNQSIIQSASKCQIIRPIISHLHTHHIILQKLQIQKISRNLSITDICQINPVSAPCFWTLILQYQNTRPPKIT